MKKSVKLNPELFDEQKYNDNMVEEAAETLLEAEEIKKDPLLMKAVQKHLDNKKEKITSLRDLKDKANNYSQEETDEGE